MKLDMDDNNYEKLKNLWRIKNKIKHACRNAISAVVIPLPLHSD